MIPTLIWILILFLWLGYETDWFTIRLESYGYQLANKRPKHFADYEAHNSFKKSVKNYWNIPILHSGGNCDASQVSEVTYHIVLDPGINEPLCGWDWLDKHCADLVGFEHKVQLAIAGVRYDMTIKAPSILNEVMKVNKLSKKEKLAYS